MIVVCLPRYPQLSKREQKQKNDETEKTKRFNFLPIHRRRDPGPPSCMDKFFFLTFFFFFPLSLSPDRHTNNHRVYHPHLIHYYYHHINKQKKRRKQIIMWTASSPPAPHPHHQPSLRFSSFAFRYHGGLQRLNLRSSRIAIADRRGLPFGTRLLTTFLQGFGREQSVRLTAYG